MNKHIEIAVEINPVWAEYVSDVLINKIGCSGTVLSEIEYKDEEVIKDSSNIVKGYLWVNPDKFVTLDEIQSILHLERNDLLENGVEGEHVGSWNVSLTEIVEEDWAHNWKKFWHPQKIGEKIVICPSWEEYDKQQSDIMIELDPGSAFGTGTHPTTRLCIRALEKFIQKDVQIADVGTGSGILSIAAVKLGAKSAVGVDNDPAVIHVAQENAEKNKIADLCDFYTGSAIDVKGEYEVVTANILAHILIEIMGDLKKILKQDGILILSGIIRAKAQDVIDAAQNCGLSLIEVTDEDNWVAVIVKN